MVVIDHFSRRIMGFEIFGQQPTAAQVASAMERIRVENNVTPKYLVSDQGSQFVATEFRNWCNAKDIKQRFGAIGEYFYCIN
jgi:transposase InsO family protein